MTGAPKDRSQPVYPFARVAPGTVLVAVDELGDPGAVSVVFGEGIMRADVAVVRSGGGIRAFVNSCPHAGTPLETFDGRFFDEADPTILVCSTHGARFRADDGYCVSGPCQGLSLRAVAVRIEDGKVIVA